MYLPVSEYDCDGRFKRWNVYATIELQSHFLHHNFLDFHPGWESKRDDVTYAIHPVDTPCIDSIKFIKFFLGFHEYRGRVMNDASCPSIPYVIVMENFHHFHKLSNTFIASDKCLGTSCWDESNLFAYFNMKIDYME